MKNHIKRITVFGFVPSLQYFCHLCFLYTVTYESFTVFENNILLHACLDLLLQNTEYFFNFSILLNFCLFLIRFLRIFLKTNSISTGIFYYICLIQLFFQQSNGLDNGLESLSKRPSHLIDRIFICTLYC